ncbi:MAG: protein kinase [Nannocystaceae bacterium]
MGGEPSADHALLGQLVDDRYRVLRLIGRGGMGAVYEAEAVRLGRKCAFKVLLPEYTRNATAVQRFRREAHVAARVKHPHVVEVFDTGTTADGHGYIAMELLQGESLERTLRREHHLPWARVRHFALQICRALGAAHSQGIIHRDMKPENCFRLTQDGDYDYIKVLDFGIAKLTEGEGEDAARLTGTNSVMGTYAYMAYEQVAGLECDHRIDIWAVGVIMYELLTGALPFPGSNQGQIWAAIFQQPPIPIGSAAPGVRISSAIESVITRALAKSPDARYPTIEALASAIIAIDEQGVLTRAQVSAVPRAQILTAPRPPQIDVQAPTAAAGAPLALERTQPATPAVQVDLREPEPRAITDIGTRATESPSTDPLTRTELALSESVATAVHDRPHSDSSGQSKVTRRSRARLSLTLGILGCCGVAVFAANALTDGSTSWVTRSAVDRVQRAFADRSSSAPWSTPERVDEPATVIIEDEPADAKPPQPEVIAAKPTKTVKTSKKRPSPPREDYETRVSQEISKRCRSSALRGCLSGSQGAGSTTVKFEVIAATGTVKANFPVYLDGSVLAACIEREASHWKLTKGDPGDGNVTRQCTITPP